MTDVDGAADAANPLALAQPEDRHSRADWEAAAAAVLRKTRRLGDEDPDAAVWDKLARTTLDGIAITPLGTPDLLDGLADRGRPTRAGDWDIRARLAGADAKLANEQALVDLDGGVTSLWVGSRRHRPRRRCSTGCCSTSPRSCSNARRRRRGREGVPRPRRRYVDLHPAPTSGAPARRRDAGRRRRPGPGAPGCSGVVVDGTAVHDRGASDVQELALLACRRRRRTSAP